MLIQPPGQKETVCRNTSCFSNPWYFFKRRPNDAPNKKGKYFAKSINHYAMSYEILSTDQGLKIIHVTGLISDLLTGWLIQFANGKEVAVYNSGNGWVQSSGETLNTLTLMAIGKCINDAAEKKNAKITDSYFYDMLI